MKVACPACSRGTIVDNETGDFPTRCEHCGGFLRRPSEAGTVRGLRLVETDSEAARPRRIQSGALSGLLIATCTSEQNPGVIAGRSYDAAAPAGSTAESGLLRPESRREVARAFARQQALRRAELKGNQQTLTALGWAGLALVALLGLSALFLKTHSLWHASGPGTGSITSGNPQ